MPYTLPALPYAYNALEPHIDARTMEIHHTKHHQAYINNVNNAIKDTEFDNLPVEKLIADLNKLPENIRGAVRNNGGGHANHSLFWTIMGPGAGGTPAGDLGAAINSTFGSFDNFKTEFTKAATTRFGSGWAWLSLSGGKLGVVSTPIDFSPIMDG
jgi:Fe-Mn family superoxide dismutase